MTKRGFIVGELNKGLQKRHETEIIVGVVVVATIIIVIIVILMCILYRRKAAALVSHNVSKRLKQLYI